MLLYSKGKRADLSNHYYCTLVEYANIKTILLPRYHPHQKRETDWLNTCNLNYEINCNFSISRVKKMRVYMIEIWTYVYLFWLLEIVPLSYISAIAENIFVPSILALALKETNFDPSMNWRYIWHFNVRVHWIYLNIIWVKESRVSPFSTGVNSKQKSPIFILP